MCAEKRIPSGSGKDTWSERSTRSRTGYARATRTIDEIVAGGGKHSLGAVRAFVSAFDEPDQGLNGGPRLNEEEAMMTDRGYVEKAADAGAGKISLLQEDPLRYMLRAVGAGMGLTLVVFVFWVLKQNLHDISLGAVIASGFFGVGLMIIVFTNTELFTSNNMYLTVSSAEGRTSWRQAALLWISCYFGNPLARSSLRRCSSAPAPLANCPPIMHYSTAPCTRHTRQGV